MWTMSDTGVPEISKLAMKTKTSSRDALNNYLLKYCYLDLKTCIFDLYHLYDYSMTSHMIKYDKYKKKMKQKHASAFVLFNL